MKRFLLSALAGLVIGVAALGATTSCDKVENSKELTELWALILEGKLQNEADFTPESWAPFALALTHAEQVAGSKAPALQTINEAIDRLHTTYHALVRVHPPRTPTASVELQM
jgi:hypothetical protein